MCGIAGVLGELEGGAAQRLATTMAARLVHRGPDDAGDTVLDLGEGALALAHRRLAILDLTSAGRQPMELDGGRLRVVYNGEIYNYIELRRELEGLGRAFRTRTDTEVLLHAYDAWGEECLSRFNGMWSFALWDHRQRALFCAVDPSGIKPFYYAERPGAFLFASELRAFLADEAFPRRVEVPRLALYLLGGVTVFDEGTLYTGARRLRPGGALLVNVRGPARTFRWWRPRRIFPPPTLPDAAVMLREALRDSIRLRYRSDVPVGVTLSGGIDSAGIVCTIADMARRGELALPHGLRTFTAGTRDEAVDESSAAQSLARSAGATSWTVHPDATERLRADLETLVLHQDEPFLGLSPYMQFCVMRAVRETGTVVVLSGQGPDELFNGYPWHYARSWRDALRSGPVTSAAGDIWGSLWNSGTPPWRLLGHVADLATPWARRLRYRMRSGSFLEPRAVNGEVFDLLEHAVGSVAGKDPFFSEVEGHGLPALLRYEDRNSMAFSVESRLPYLDPRILDLAYSLPAKMKMRDGWSKFVLRTALDGVAPREVVWRKRKIGFSPPRAHFREIVLPRLREALDGDARSRELVRVDRLTRYAAEPHADPQLCWRFLNAELWMRLNRLDL